MPNHYHILAKQISDDGIEKYIGNMQNSYARYMNIKTKRVGSLFQSPFKAVRIETGEQLLHVARYIHLNPLTSFVLTKEKELDNYPWNSYVDYISDFPRPIVNTQPISKIMSTKEKFIAFTLNQLDYQRKLHQIGYLMIDNKP